MKNTEKERIIAALANCENVHDVTTYFDGIIQLKTKFNQNKKIIKGFSQIKPTPYVFCALRLQPFAHQLLRLLFRLHNLRLRHMDINY